MAFALSDFPPVRCGPSTLSNARGLTWAESDPLVRPQTLDRKSLRRQEWQSFRWEPLPALHRRLPERQGHPSRRRTATPFASVSSIHILRLQMWTAFRVQYTTLVSGRTLFLSYRAGPRRLGQALHLPLFPHLLVVRGDMEVPPTESEGTPYRQTGRASSMCILVWIAQTVATARSTPRWENGR